MQITKSSNQTTNKCADVRFAPACPGLKTKADVRNAPPSPQTTATLSLISAASCYQANLGRERRDISADWLETRRGRGQRQWVYISRRRKAYVSVCRTHCGYHQLLHLLRSCTALVFVTHYSRKLARIHLI